MKRKLIDTQRLVAKTGLTRRQIYQLVLEKRLPAIRIRAKKLLFDEALVDEALRRAETVVMEG
jgi:excisionase family DNA binding protein